MSSWNWRPAPIPLKFLLGEYRLGVKKFPGLLLNEHFSKLVNGSPEPEPPFRKFPDSATVLKASSYPIPERLPRWKLLPWAIRYVPHQYQRFYVLIQGSFEDYLGKFSSKSRANLKKKIKKYAEHCGGIDWRTYQSAAELEEFHKLAYPLSQQTYQAKLFRSGLPNLEAFRQEVSQYPEVRGYLLFHDQKPISYLFCPVQDGNLLYQRVGYDSAYQDWSPGTVLLYLVLESLFAKPDVQTFDFTEGEGPHKEFFANRDCLCADLHYFERSPGNIILVGLHTSLWAISRLLTWLTDRLGIKTWLKKRLRGK